MKHFYIRYCGAYVAVNAVILAAFLLAVAYFQDENIEHFPFQATFLCPILSPLLPAYLFRHDHARAPNMQEARKFSFGIFVILFCVVMALDFMVSPSTRSGVSEEHASLIPVLINIALFSVIGQFLFWGAPRLTSIIRK